MARAWLINGKAIATKIKNASHYSNYQIKDVGIEANRECPNCQQLIDNSDVTLEWLGLPAGVKFDPTDAELLDHLAGKVGLGNSKAHIFIDEFIPTLEEDQGICYTHPENLPGVKKDGSSVHFFHRTSNAYATGQRKRRKIHRGCNSISEERVRWHKTGKTKPVMENGVQKGWKKIMVLYRSLKKGCKADKANWVMHQYHLGIEEEEKDGELVVSKIFYQQNQKHVDKIGNERDEEECHVLPVVVPRTPKTNTPLPPRPKEHYLSPEAPDNNPNLLAPQKGLYEVEVPLSIVERKEKIANESWWAGESQAVQELDESLLCNEVLDSFAPAESSFGFHYSNPERGCIENTNMLSAFPELDTIEMDTPPDFQLADLQFGSQDSITSWLDRL
ncbi:SUPPRESSOR OF GAMMA RESPONSE 1-like [Iris pallida]|uniref:SUPPRESSOR OF GAMMA RESPONSE 1-like n=1 Tax=Iris pallida TaxID=29817 RepID=A0AAX6IA10_IRIPA|nr:SUPPRESSOR OF GAMMA RESPONSE 1-like [Iris pallida]